MAKFSAILLIVLLAHTASAGDEKARPAPRREFRQRATYPHVFEPVPYLENHAPLPLRFGAPSEDCPQHNPPSLPKEAKKQEPIPTPPAPELPPPQPTPEPPAPAPKPQPTATPAPAKPEPSPSPSESAAAPAYPAPDNAQPVAQQDDLDMAKYPSEVVEIFKNPYNVTKSHQHFFDPIFEPAKASEAPPSKATFHEQ